MNSVQNFHSQVLSPAREASLMSELHDLHVGMGTLSELVNELRGRLSPVIREVPVSQTMGKIADVAVQSKAASEMRVARMQMLDISERIRDMINTLDL